MIFVETIPKGNRPHRRQRAVVSDWVRPAQAFFDVGPFGVNTIVELLGFGFYLLGSHRRACNDRQEIPIHGGCHFVLLV